MENDFSEIRNGTSPLISPLNKSEKESLEPERDTFPDEQSDSFSSSFFIELIYGIKSSLGFIKIFAQISGNKFYVDESCKYFNQIVAEIDKIDVVLNRFLIYKKVTTPINKTNTVHTILEEVLKKHQVKLEEREILLFRRFENDLPETTVPDEQLKYILDSVLQYAIASIPSSAGIGLSTRSIPPEASKNQALLEKDWRYIEISVVFTGYKKPMEQFMKGLGAEVPPKEEPFDLILRMVKEIVQKNRGVMKFEVDEKKSKAFVSLIFPAERRKVVYYKSGDEKEKNEIKI